MTFVKSTIKDPSEMCGEIKKQFIARKSLEWENNVKEIIRSEDAIDTGQYINSISTIVDESGFIGMSSAEHAKWFRVSALSHIGLLFTI